MRRRAARTVGWRTNPSPSPLLRQKHYGGQAGPLPWGEGESLAVHGSNAHSRMVMLPKELLTFGSAASAASQRNCDRAHDKFLRHNMQMSLTPASAGC